MSRRTQSLIWRSLRSPSGEVLLFLASFVGLRFLLRAMVGAICHLVGFSEALSLQIIENNELSIQCLSWLGAALVLRQVQHRPLKHWGLPSLRQVAEAFPNPFFGGFLLASLGVALSVFLGLSKVEAPVGGLWTYIVGLPAVLYSAVLWTLWLLVLEYTRRFLSRGLDIDLAREPVGLLMLIAFEGFLIFSVFNGSSGIVEQLVLASVALWIASTLLLAQKAGRPGASLRRVGFIAGLLVTLVHVYGLPVAGVRHVSLVYLFPGTHPQPTGSLAEQGVLGQVLFVALFWIAANALLRKTLRDRRTL
jgi:hypothetical protein